MLKVPCLSVYHCAFVGPLKHCVVLDPGSHHLFTFLQAFKCYHPLQKRLARNAGRNANSCRDKTSAGLTSMQLRCIISFVGVFHEKTWGLSSGRWDTTASLGVPAIFFLHRSDGPIYKWIAGRKSGIHRHTTNAILVCLTLPVPEPPVCNNNWGLFTIWGLRISLAAAHWNQIHSQWKPQEWVTSSNLPMFILDVMF